MGSEDLFKKRRKSREKRKSKNKTPKANSFLIITEGKRTEPLYFKGLKKIIEDRVGGQLDIVSSPCIDISGEGCSTGKLIEKTEEIIKKSKFFYQNIWIVFDRDDFQDFDQAIKQGKDKGYKIAWSNQSFEYWLYLHFEYSDSALHRDDWNIKLDNIFKKNKIGDASYKKNYKDIYKMLDDLHGVDKAIKNAKKRMACFDENVTKPSEFDPGTKVYELVEELRKYLDD